MNAQDQKTAPKNDSGALKAATPIARRDPSQGVLYVGIDLGTSRTSISASNGTRATFDSLVGYPRDVVSRKLLKRDVLYGREALENRLALRLFRPLERGAIKYSDDVAGVAPDEVALNLEAAKSLVRHAVELAGPRPGELVYGVIGCPAQASIRNKQTIVDVARETLDSVVICSEPFSVAYGLDMLTDCLVVDIGAGTTDLCRMKGSMPDEEDQITIPFAGDHLDLELQKLFRERCGAASFTINMVKEIKERHAFVTESAEPVLVSFPVNGKPVEFDVTAEMRKGCRRIVPPVIEAIEKLIASFDPEFQARLRQNVLLAGGGSQIHGLDRAVEEALIPLGGGSVRCVQEPVYAGANGALRIAYDMPLETWEQLR
jgi:rod shape-determining protein MreB